MGTTPIDDYDFGFNFADDEVTTPAANNDELLALQAKVDSMLDAQTKILEDKYSKLLEDKYKAKLKEVEAMILPLLLNLKKNPDKAYIHWPNRTAIIDKQIEKITAITRG